MAADLPGCMAACSGSRASYCKLFSDVPESVVFTGDGESLLFLSTRGAAMSQLYLSGLGGGGEWSKLASQSAARQFSRSEQLLRERMRSCGSGISHYEYLEAEDAVLVQDGCQCLLASRKGWEVKAVFPEMAGAVDFKLCPSECGLLACWCEGDLWLLTGKGGKHRLTHTAELKGGRKVTAGHPSFIIQEEFDRYTGYWWQPHTGKDGVYSILYEEVDETQVGVAHTLNPSTQTHQTYCYPMPGTKNAKSTLKLLTFHFSESSEVCVEHKSLPWALEDCFPHTEYLPRLGWMPSGHSVWVQLLDRRQQHLVTTVISKEAFCSAPPPPPPPPPLPYTLYEEKSESWINVTNVLEFLSPPSPPSPPSPNGVEETISFLKLSEDSGYQHLYLCTATPPEAMATPPEATMSSVVIPSASLVSRQLTGGEWCVHGDKVWVDEKRRVVYFLANTSDCRDQHLYAVSLDASAPDSSPVQLTPYGLYYSSVAMDTDCQHFVATHSSYTSAPGVSVYCITHTPSLCAQLTSTLWKGPDFPPSYTPPIEFSTSAATGEALVGLVFPPAGLQEGRTYPVVQYVYGGPHVQLVTRALPRYIVRLCSWLERGFAVVLLDNRGSANRGVAFEAHLQGHMGSVEVEDQVQGLLAAGSAVQFLDLNRVAVYGWSYGGYLALMCLAKAPLHTYKMGVAGAPVTDWLLYDTGYTERYLGVPPTDSICYARSSVLPHVRGLPTEPGRLLVLHGLDDENVLFAHTSRLVDALVRQGRPYQLQVFTGERHGIRSPSTALHAEATVLCHLKTNL